MEGTDIVITDSEWHRLAATTKSVGALFGMERIAYAEWDDVENVGDFIGRQREQCHSLLSQKRLPLVITDNDGILNGFVREVHAASHLVIACCLSRPTIDALLERAGIDPSAIGHIQTASVAGLTRTPHHQRVLNYFATLPADHPFSIGSKSTTYSTALPETYAASNR